MTSPPPTPPAVEGTFLPGTEINGRYEILSLASASDPNRLVDVYEALDLNTERLVFMRFVSLSVLEGADRRTRARALERFDQEARLLAALRHECIPALLAHERALNDQPYTVIALGQGRSLREELRRCASNLMEPGRVLGLLKLCLEGLEQMHDRDCIHRGLWPENLWLADPDTDRERLCIVNFTTTFDSTACATETTGAMRLQGPWAWYAAPEYISLQGHEVLTAAVDVYQIGLLLVEMLSGQPAVAHTDDPMDALNQHTRFRGLAPSVPDWLRLSPIGPVIERALQRNPADRYPDARALREALEGIDPEALCPQIVAAATPQLPGYTVHGVLSDRGGQALILRASNRDTPPREVAVKLFRPPDEPSEARNFRQRFAIEAEALRTLSHPNVVRLLDHGQEPDGERRPFLVLELLQGRTLADALDRDGAMAPDRALRLMGGVLNGLALGHRADPPLVHKDLKPANLFLIDEGTERERLVVLDFGAARRCTGANASFLTQVELRMSTAQYTAPEYARTVEAVSPATDVYQAALILIECLTGRILCPFEGSIEALAWHTSGKAITDLPIRLSVHRPLDNVLRKALDLDPCARYLDAAAFRDALAVLDRTRLPDLRPPRPAPAPPTDPEADEVDSDPSAPTSASTPGGTSPDRAPLPPSEHTTEGRPSAPSSAPRQGTGVRIGSMVEARRSWLALVEALAQDTAPEALLPHIDACLQNAPWPADSDEWLVIDEACRIVQRRARARQRQLQALHRPA